LGCWSLGKANQLCPHPCEQDEKEHWQAFIYHNGTNEYIGTYTTPERGAMMYDKKARGGGSSPPSAPAPRIRKP
jgi:hypothetical protein